MADKYTAVWVSHTSISDYLKCPRSYFLKNIYKDRNTGHKIQIMSPALALGQAVHEVLENLSSISTRERFLESPIQKLDTVWEKIRGKKGGFVSAEEEFRYKDRVKQMINKIVEHPGPLSSLAVKIKEDLPHYWLSEAENIILCGKIDWLEYLQESETVHIIDFKTSKKEEDPNSLQLPIYLLLASNCQKRPVSKASYWYLEYDDNPIEKSLPSIEEANLQITKISRQIKIARQLDKLDCPHGKDGCMFCIPHERILRGEGELVGTSNTRQDIYILPKANSIDDAEDSIIL